MRRLSWWAALLLAACTSGQPRILHAYAEGNYVHIAAPFSGTITKLYVRVGARIAAATPLFTIAPDKGGTSPATIRTPFTARVTDILIDQDAWVASGSAVIALLPPQNISVSVSLPADQLGNLRSGSPVRLHCDSCGPGIDARIESITPIPGRRNPESALTYQVNIQPSPTDAVRLSPGQPVDVLAQ